MSSQPVVSLPLAVIYSWGRLPGMDVRGGRLGRSSGAGAEGDA